MRDLTQCYDRILNNNNMIELELVCHMFNWHGKLMVNSVLKFIFTGKFCKIFSFFLLFKIVIIDFVTLRYNFLKNSLSDISFTVYLSLSLFFYSKPYKLLHMDSSVQNFKPVRIYSKQTKICLRMHL